MNLLYGKLLFVTQILCHTNLMKLHFKIEVAPSGFIFITGILEASIQYLSDKIVVFSLAFSFSKPIRLFS